MEKDEYIKIAKKKFKGEPLKLILKQIENYYFFSVYKIKNNNYKIGDQVALKKGTLLHGTYKNIDGLKEIVANGLLSSLIIDARTSKYPACVGVWNIQADISLKDYIDFYSGGTITCFSHNDKKDLRKVIWYHDMPNLMNDISKNEFLTWKMEQTKEARFLPSLVQNQIQIGIIFNGNNKAAKALLKGDILNPRIINDKDVKSFVNENYYEDFISGRKHKDCYFTDRESAILFGIPSNLIEGILVGRKYEKNKLILKKIKNLLPYAYICNLDGKVIF